MPAENAMVSSSSARIDALKMKHKLLSNKLEAELNRPFISEYKISELKREKLKLKEEIEGIRQVS